MTWEQEQKKYDQEANIVKTHWVILSQPERLFPSKEEAERAKNDLEAYHDVKQEVVKVTLILQNRYKILDTNEQLQRIVHDNVRKLPPTP